MDTPQHPDGLHFLQRPIDSICPACSGQLAVAMLDEVKVAACAGCGGILLQAAAFGELVRLRRGQFSGRQLVPSPPDARQLQVRRSCPACGGQMETHPYCGPGNVVIDSCAPCELVWLDRHELSDIVRWPGERDKVV